jgi:hypothetical protein
MQAMRSPSSLFPRAPSSPTTIQGIIHRFFSFSPIALKHREQQRGFQKFRRGLSLAAIFRRGGPFFDAFHPFVLAQCRQSLGHGLEE